MSPGAQTRLRSMYRRPTLWAAVAMLSWACGGGRATLPPPTSPPPKPPGGEPGSTTCVPTAPPSSLRLNPFYKKYCNAERLPIVSSDKVPDLALRHAWDQVRHMLAARPDVRAAMVNLRTRVAIMAVTEVTT